MEPGNTDTTEDLRADLQDAYTQQATLLKKINYQPQ